MVRLEPRPLSLLWLHAALIALRSPLMGNCMITRREQDSTYECSDNSAITTAPIIGKMERS